MVARTSNIYLATALLASGFKDVTIEKIKHKEGIYFFIFDSEVIGSDMEIWDSLVDSYHSGRMTVDPKKYEMSWKRLKRQIYKFKE